MNFDPLDAATRKELLARMVLEKRAAAREKKASDKWQPLSMSTSQSNASGSNYLCSCMDVKRGFATICPPHMLSFH